MEALSIPRQDITINAFNIKNRKVVKRNELIEAHYQLSLIEQKMILIFSCMLSSSEDPLNSYFEITARDFCQLVGLNKTNNYKEHIRKVILKLMNRPSFKIGNTDYNWIASCEYKPTGIISFEFPQRLIPYLQFSKTGHFTKYWVSNILPLKHQYSPRIYELCKQYQKVKERVFSIQELKDKLGIGKDQYQDFYEFKRKVIIPTEKELYRGTDIGIKHHVVKSIGKKVTHIKFTIFKGKSEKFTPDLLIENISNASNKLSQDKNTTFYQNRVTEYYQDVKNFPEDNKPTFEEYLKKRGMKVIKSKDRNYKLDIAWIEGSQAQMEFFKSGIVTRFTMV